MSTCPTPASKYKAAIREFDAVLEHAKAISATLVGFTVRERHHSFGEQIFVKLLAHCLSLRCLVPDPAGKAERELWDLPSLCAIARCVIESYDAFEYIAKANGDLQEIEFRIILWEAHAKTRCLRILDLIGSENPCTEVIRQDANVLLVQLQSHPAFSKLKKEDRKKLIAGDPPAFHLSQRERCAQSGINFDFYTAVTMQLSQHVHTFPFAIQQLFQFRAGSPKALQLITLPISYSLLFLVLAIDGMKEIFPENSIEAPSRTKKSMALWRLMAKQGVKSAT
ncbi:MAG: hypothetical protein AB9M60_19540 [Leptothrix sp. (in: b-proteobacteria)]